MSRSALSFPVTVDRDLSFATVKVDRNLATGRVRGFSVVVGDQEFRKWVGGSVLPAGVDWHQRCTRYSDSPWTACVARLVVRLDNLVAYSF